MRIATRPRRNQGPWRHRILRWIVAVPAGLAMLLMSSPEPVEALPPGGEFIIKCAYTGTSAQVDPILAPGGTSAHVHDFFGNKTTSASSTYDSLTGVPNDSTGSSCQDTHDTAAYWVPQLYFNGQVWHPAGDANTGYAIRVYYTDFTGIPVVPPPADLQMVSGFP